MPFLLDVLDQQLSLNLAIWVFPLAFLVHDLEEIFTMERFARENRERFPRFLRNMVLINTTQMCIAVIVLFLITLLAAYLATRPQRQMGIFITALLMFLVHVIGHVAFPIVLRKYTPGLITAVLVVLPYSLYAFHRLYAANLINDNNFNVTTMLIGLLLLAPLILFVRQVGKLVVR